MDLSTTYLGLELKNPIVPCSSPLTEKLDSAKKLEDCGASAVVLHSLFEEQLTIASHQLNYFLDYQAESFGESLSYFPDFRDFKVGPDQYLEHVSQAKKSLGIPVIASLNGNTSGGWIDYAKKIQEAGADALELNIYYLPTNPSIPSAHVEKNVVDIVSQVRKTISIPLAVKLSPFFSAMANMASQIAAAGANGLVLFNRFYQPDIDLDSMEVKPVLRLSDSQEINLPLRWIAILHGVVDIDFALTTGVHTHLDVLKAMMAGAKTAMMASELLRSGPARVSSILADLQRWMEEHEYASIKQMQGSMSQQHVADPSTFARANYLKILGSFDRSLIPGAGIGA